MQGTVTSGDITLTFFIREEANQGTLAVQDGLSGKQWVDVGLPGHKILAALIVMLDGDEHELPQELYDLACSVQPDDPELRFIP